MKGKVIDALQRWKPKNWLPPDPVCPEAPEKAQCTKGWHLYELHDGTLEAFERCPIYWQRKGRTVDPTDRRRLLPLEEETMRRKSEFRHFLDGDE